MKKYFIIFFLFSIALFSSDAIIAQNKANTWTGKIVGLNCHLATGAQKIDHGKCLKSCVKNGQPMGLLTDDGTLVLITADNRKTEKQLIKMAGQRVNVSGKMGTHDGMEALVVQRTSAAGS